MFVASNHGGKAVTIVLRMIHSSIHLYILVAIAISISALRGNQLVSNTAYEISDISRFQDFTEISKASGKI